MSINKFKEKLSYEEALESDKEAIEWLKKHKINQYIQDVTYEKPRACLYIDDKAHRFHNWQETLCFIDEENK